MLITDDRIGTEIDRQQVCRYLGYGNNYKIPPRISSLIDEYIEHARYFIRPSYSYNIRNIDCIQGSVVFIEKLIMFESQELVHLLEHCHKVAVFIVTIGMHLEEMAQQLSEDGRILRAAVLDAMGSSAVVGLVDLIHSRIEKEAGAQGLVISRHFSPGYRDWDLRQQKALFEAVDSSAVGVQLTDQSLMLPRKSISGIIGIGTSNSDVGNYDPCEACGRHACLGSK